MMFGYDFPQKKKIIEVRIIAGEYDLEMYEENTLENVEWKELLGKTIVGAEETQGVLSLVLEGEQK